MCFDLEQRPRPKKPYIATLDQVTIVREPEGAVIAYDDPDVGDVHFRLGPMVGTMSDAEILDAHNACLRSIDALRSSEPYAAEETPPGLPQIEYHALSDQWVPLTAVLRCIVSDGGPDDETSVWVDDHELSLREFGRLLSVYDGWGMRIVFVPDDKIEFEPDIRVRANTYIRRSRGDPR